MIHAMNSLLLTFGVLSFLTKQKVCEGVIEALLLYLNYLVRQTKNRSAVFWHIACSKFHKLHFKMNVLKSIRYRFSRSLVS